jgi:hypothetical protein
VDLLAEGTEGELMNRVREGVERLEQISPTLHRQLKAMVDQQAADVAAFRQAIERWFDDYMAALSARYRRHTRWVAFVLGTAIAIFFNINAIAAADELWENAALRDAAVAAATGQVDRNLAGGGACAEEEPADVLACIEDETSKLVDTGFPFGWKCPEGCDSVGAMVANAWSQAGAGRGWDVLARIAGWLAAGAAFSMGATFWFDTLKRLTGLRTRLTGSSTPG